MRQEIAHAIREQKNIVPVTIGSFSFPAELPADIANLPRHQRVAYSHQYFDAMMATIMEGLVLGQEEAEDGPPVSQRAGSPSEDAGPPHWSYDVIGGAAVGLFGGIINWALVSSQVTSLDVIGLLSVCGVVPGAAAAMFVRRTRGFLPRAFVGALSGAAATALVFAFNYLALGASIEQFNRHVPFWLGPTSCSARRLCWRSRSGRRPARW